MKPPTNPSEKTNKDVVKGKDIDSSKIFRRPLDTATMKPPTNPSEKTNEDVVKEKEIDLSKIFLRPPYTEPRHPLLSSPIARLFSEAAFGPVKPKWYFPLSIAQLQNFENIVKLVNEGREDPFAFEEFLERLQRLDHTITRDEVISILKNMEKYQFEELDFGKFLFLLAYKCPLQTTDQKTIPMSYVKPKKKHVTRRQSLILSAISNFMLITTYEDIHRFYTACTRPRYTELSFHLENYRLLGLTERQMDKKREEVEKLVKPMITSITPYSLPAPRVPRIPQFKLHRNINAARPTKIMTAIPTVKKVIPHPIKPLKETRKLGEKVLLDTEDDLLYHLMEFGRIPLPEVTLSRKKIKEIKAKYTHNDREYIMERVRLAKKDYQDRVRYACLLYAKRNLDKELRKGFASQEDEDNFIKIFGRYLPHLKKDFKYVSVCLKSVDFLMSEKRQNRFAERLAFGRRF